MVEKRRTSSCVSLDMEPLLELRRFSELSVWFGSCAVLDYLGQKLTVTIYLCALLMKTR